MTLLAISSTPVPLNVELGEAIARSDEELFEFCALNPELRIERTGEGDLIVMTPAGWASGHRSAEIVRALTAWASEDETGLVSDFSVPVSRPAWA